MSDELIELPEGWEWKTLGELVLNIQYGYTTSATEQPTGIKFLRITDLQENSVDWQTVPFCNCSEIDKYKLSKGDIVVARTGATTGKSFLLKEIAETTVFASYLIRLHTSILCPPEYLALFMQSADYWKQITNVSKGTAQPGANASILSKLIIPIAPLNEQKRIVAKIEELNDRTQRAKEALETIPQLCDRFRQSVLAAAFRGDLTADWREQNPDVEPASVLLERTLQEKQDRTKNKLKHNELNLLIESELEELPKGWHWTTFEQVSERVTVGHVGSMKDEYISEGIPFLRSQNVRENRFEPIGLQYISKGFHEKLSKSSLQPGDLVVVRSGSVGITCVIPDNLKEANCSDLVIVKQPKAINSYYGSYYMNSVARSHVNEKQVGVALIHFNTKSMAQLPIPIAPYKEQEEIIGRVQKLFNSADLIEQQYKEAKKYLDQLNQSILAKAFRGELVPQDPDDEPASVLLERIRAEREKLNNGKQKSQRTSKRKSKTVEEQ
jgi:type I restriction enzyme, S subunit